MKKKITIFLGLLALSICYLNAQCDESTNLAPLSTVHVSSTWELPDWGWSLASLTDGVRTSVEKTDTEGSMGWTTTADDVTINQEQWVILKLDAVHKIKTVQLFPRSAPEANIGDAFPVDFTIDVSVDSISWTTVVTETGYPKPVITDEGEVFDFDPTEGQYVRLYATLLGTTLENGVDVYRLQLAEMEVYASCSTVSVETSEQINNNNIKVYPTNVVDELIIETNNNYLKIIRIVDVSGIVKSYVNVEGQVSKYNLNVEFLNNGVYILQCEFSDGTISFNKIIKQ